MRPSITLRTAIWVSLALAVLRASPGLAAGGPPDYAAAAARALMERMVAEATANVDCRILPDETAAEALAQLTAAIADPIAVSEADARRAHGIDECIPASSLRPAVELLYRLVVELAAPGARS